jgi:hypothetical protein
MSLEKIVQEALNKNPLGTMKALEEELNARISSALEEKFQDILDEDCYREAASYLLDHNIEVDDLTEEELDILSEKAFRGRVTPKVVKPKVIRSRTPRNPRPPRVIKQPRTRKNTNKKQPQVLSPTRNNPPPPSIQSGGSGILGSIVKGAANLAYKGARAALINRKGNFRLSTAGRADSIEAKTARMKQQRLDRNRLTRAKTALERERNRP